MMDMMVAMKLAEYYPERAVIWPIHDTKKNTWGAAILAVEENGMYGDTLYQLDSMDYPDENAAVSEIGDEVMEAMEVIKVMSN